MRLEEMPTLEGEIERLKQQLSECQAWKDDVVNMIATEVKTARKQWQREALLDAANKAKPYSYRLLSEFERMAKELE